MIVVFFRGCNRRFSIFVGVVQVKSIKKNITGICYGIKTLSFNGYKSFEYVSLISWGLLVFFRLISDQEVCFRLRKFLWLSTFLGSFWDFRRSSLSFLPQSIPQG